MKINQCKAGSKVDELIAEVVSMDEPRNIMTKYGKKARLVDAVIKDETGRISLTLWNDDIDQIGIGDSVKITNGWCSEFRNVETVSAGKFGKIIRLSQDKLGGEGDG